MGLRTRIGVMVPSTNTTFEADFQLVAPRDITIHGQRLWLTNDADGAAGMDRMNAEVEAGARYLATARVNAVAYGCTTGSFYKGPGWDQEMIATIERVYAFAEAPLGNVARSAMTAYRETHPPGRHGTVVYRLDDFRLDADERRAALRFYQDRVGVPDE